MADRLNPLVDSTVYVSIDYFRDAGVTKPIEEVVLADFPNDLRKRTEGFDAVCRILVVLADGSTYPLWQKPEDPE